MPVPRLAVRRDGRCTYAPFAARTPKVSIGGFPVREHSGLIFVYIGPDEPEWEVPEIPEATSREFARPIDDVRTARIHIQEMRENIVDESHFHFIHGQSEPPVQDLRPDGPFAEVRGRIHRRVLGWDVDNTFDVFMYGPGVMVVRVHGSMLSLTAVALTNPIDERTSEMRMLYYLRKPAGMPFLRPRSSSSFARRRRRGPRGDPHLGPQDPPGAACAAAAREGHQGAAPLVRPVLPRRARRLVIRVQ